MDQPFLPKPIVLAGAHARLEPLTSAHADDLFVAGADAAIWRYLPCAPPKSIDDLRAYIDDALDSARDGGQVPFAIVAVDSGRAIGSTRFLDIQPGNQALEIGWTWVGTPWQRTAINTECKYLLLRHAFEDLGAIRVQLKTDGRNQRSQTAIARIGGRCEGVLRRNRRLWDGFVRDTVVFSILDSEWPDVKAALELRAAQPSSS